MKFKIDENLPVEIAELLVSAGHDAKTVNDQKLQGVKDPVLIVLRVGSQVRHHLIEVFQRTIPLLGREPLKEHLWIAEETRVRIRGKDEEQ